MEFLYHKQNILRISLKDLLNAKHTKTPISTI